MPQYKLYYFNVKARGEVIRLIFAYAGVDFEDIRIEFADWPKIKPTTPYGCVPYLEVDGKPLAQSLTIARYLAKKYGLFPESEWDQAQAEELGDVAMDMWNASRPANPVREKDEEKRKSLIPSILKESIYPPLDKIEARLANSSSGWLVGDKISWVDILLFSATELFSTIFGNEAFEKYENVRKLYLRIKEIPQIQQYLSKRQDTIL